MDNNQFKYCISQNLAKINDLENLAAEIMTACQVIRGNLNVVLSELNQAKHPELKDITRVTHHRCSICSSPVGYQKCIDGLWRFDPSCDCCPSSGNFRVVSEDEVYEQFQKNKKLEEEK